MKGQNKKGRSCARRPKGDRAKVIRPQTQPQVVEGICVEMKMLNEVIDYE